MEGRTRPGTADGVAWRTTRRHGPLPHTADVGLEAVAPDPRALFEEAATALAELTAELAPGAEVSTWEDVTLEGGDLADLAYAWLNELIALIDIRRAGIVAVSVDRFDSGEADGAWGLHARVGLRRYAEGGVRPRSQAKAATYHGLAVERGPDGWTLRAYLDV